LYMLQVLAELLCGDASYSLYVHLRKGMLHKYITNI
jgi:hypothetical protein